MATEYIVSARKYRPDSFSSIVGQGAMSSTLRTAVLQGRMAHAFLFCGPRGVGKTTAARVLAKTINCMNLTAEGEACNECVSCQAFNEQRSFNIFELDAASNNGVDEIRNLTDQVAVPPTLGKYKVYIIDEVHMLSQAAFNAFLKTLEEPPQHAIFILATTEKHKILPTILSRCQIYDFKRITVMDIVRHLAYVAKSEGIEAEEEALGLIAEKADGGMRDALSMFDRVASFSGGKITYAGALESLNVLDHSYYVRFVENLTRGSYQELLLLLDELLARGFDGQIIVNGLAGFMRDLLVVQHPSTLHLLEKPKSVAQLYETTAKTTATASLHKAIAMLVACDSQYRGASNKRLLVELTLLNLLTLFVPTALGASPETPTTPVTPSVVRAQSTPQATPQTTTTSQVGPQTNPQAQHQPSPAQQVATPQPIVAPASAPETTKKPSPHPPTNQDLRSTRQAFREGLRGRMTASSSSQSTRSASTTDEATEVLEEKSFDETMLQRAWMTFIEQELPTDQIITRQTMVASLPKLLSATEAEVGISDSATFIDPVQAVLPQAISSIRRQLSNGKINIHIRPLPPEEVKRIPITAEEKYKAMAERYPQLEHLRQGLGLRLR